MDFNKELERFSIDDKYISEKEFESLSEIDQVRVLKHMIEDIPHDDLKGLKDIFQEITQIQEKINSME